MVEYPLNSHSLISLFTQQQGKAREESAREVIIINNRQMNASADNHFSTHSLGQHSYKNRDILKYNKLHTLAKTA